MNNEQQFIPNIVLEETMENFNLGYIQEKISSLSGDDVVAFIFDKKFSYHPDYHKQRVDILNHLPSLFKVLNNETSSIFYFCAITHRILENERTIAFHTNFGFIALNSIKDLSVNNFRLIGLNEKALNFLSFYKKTPCILPKYYFYKATPENNKIKLTQLLKGGEGKSKLLNREEFDKNNIYCFIPSHKNMVLGNNFNYPEAIHFYPSHDVLVNEYLFLLLNSSLMEFYFFYAYGFNFELDMEILSNTPIPLYPYEKQILLAWDKALFHKSSQSSPLGNNLIPSFSLNYEINNICYYFDNFFNYKVDD